jgi:hypothetical protein
MADKRAAHDLSEFYNFGHAPRRFVPIATPWDASHFIHDTIPLTPPDDD